MPIWATHLKLKEGEMLSSWIVRLASDCEMSAEQFCQIALSIKRLGLSAIDRSPDESLLKALSEGTGESIERIRESSILPEDGYALSPSGKGQTSWIIPSVTYLSLQNKKFNVGMPYCPECLHADAKPYYRKVWRYAFHPICPLHRIPLSDTCPHCNEPYSHMQPVTSKVQALKDVPIIDCWSCGKDVTEVGSAPLLDEGLLVQTLAIQNKILAGINKGAFDVPGFGYVHSKSYLDAMHYIIDTLTTGKHASDRLHYVCEKTGIDFKTHRPNPIHDIEHLQAKDRATLLCLAQWLMEEWPTRFVPYINSADIIFSNLFERIDLSYWLYATALQELNPQKVGVLSTEEIQKATLISAYQRQNNGSR